MKTLSGSDRKYLRGLANRLKPVVQVGKDGVTEGLIETVNRALDTHELIKVKFAACKDQKRELTEEIARGTKSEIPGMIGNVAMFYREHPEEEKRRIHLPGETS